MASRREAPRRLFASASMPEQRAALLDFAYRRPRWLADNTGGLQHAIDNDRAAGGWSNTRATLEQIGNAQTDWRTMSNARYFANPLAENIYQIQEGDTLAAISRKTGLPENYLRSLNPQLRDWGRINAGQRIFIVDPQDWRHGPVR